MESEITSNLEGLPKIELQDELITLRLYKVEDAAAQLAGEDEEQIKWLSGGKSTLEGIKKWIIKNQQYWINGGPIFALAIWTNESNQLVGMVEGNTDYQNVDGLEEGDANISYGLYPQARGKGYTQHAINLIIGFLKEKGVKRGVIRVEPENISSINVPERLNFQKNGQTPPKDGHVLDIYTKDLG